MDVWLKPKGTSKWKITMSGRKLFLKQVQRKKNSKKQKPELRKCPCFWNMITSSCSRENFHRDKINLFWMIGAVDKIENLVLPVFSWSTHILTLYWQQNCSAALISLLKNNLQLWKTWTRKNADRSVILISSWNILNAKLSILLEYFKELKF